MKLENIRCNDISYRQGYIEVVPGIHPDHINIEVWNAHPGADISDKALDDERVPDEAFIANTEIELSAQQARELIALLEFALAKVEKMHNRTFYKALPNFLFNTDAKRRGLTRR